MRRLRLGRNQHNPIAILVFLKTACAGVEAVLVRSQVGPEGCVRAMLDAFVAENREEIIRRCRAKVELRSIPTPTPAELEYGVPRFLDQLVDALRQQRVFGI